MSSTRHKRSHPVVIYPTRHKRSHPVVIYPTRHRRSYPVMCAAAVVLLTCLVLFSAGTVSGDGENTAPVIGSYGVTPASGNARVEFLFTAKYSDADNDAPRYMRLVVGDKDHEMRPVDPGDNNYTDGKDYYYRIKFDGPETIYYYFEASDGEHNVSSKVKTLNVEDIFEWHLDIAIVFGLYLIPTVWVIHIAHRISKSLGRIEKAIANSGKTVPGEAPGEGEGPDHRHMD